MLAYGELQEEVRHPRSLHAPDLCRESIVNLTIAGLRIGLYLANPLGAVETPTLMPLINEFLDVIQVDSERFDDERLGTKLP